MTGMNIPLMLREHGQPTIEELDREIRATTERLTHLVHQRVATQAHMLLGDSMQRAVATSATQEAHHAARE